MIFLLRQVRHLTRYFALLGCLAFAFHWLNINEKAALMLMGPPIYLASFAGDALRQFAKLRLEGTQDDLYILLPITLVYYTFIGFQIKKLWNERGFVRLLTLLALIGFLLFVHLVAWRRLYAYFLPVGG